MHCAAGTLLIAGAAGLWASAILAGRDEPQEIGAQSGTERAAVTSVINWELPETGRSRAAEPSSQAPGSRPPCSHSHAGGQGASICAPDREAEAACKPAATGSPSSTALPATRLIPAPAALLRYTGHRHERRPARHRRAAAHWQHPHRRRGAGAGCRRADSQAQGQGCPQAAPAAPSQVCWRHHEGGWQGMGPDAGCWAMQGPGRQGWAGCPPGSPPRLACILHLAPVHPHGSLKASLTTSPTCLCSWVAPPRRPLPPPPRWPAPSSSAAPPGWAALAPTSRRLRCVPAFAHF